MNKDIMETISKRIVYKKDQEYKIIIEKINTNNINNSKKITMNKFARQHLMAQKTHARIVLTLQILFYFISHLFTHFKPQSLQIEYNW